jgi:hypothetical protein
MRRPNYPDDLNNDECPCAAARRFTFLSLCIGHSCLRLRALEQ